MANKSTKDLLEELRGTVCVCGRTKRAMNTFCSQCYHSLPHAERHRLYDRIGEGYEQAYEKAVAILVRKQRVKHV